MPRARLSPVQIGMRRMRQGLYGACGLLLAAVLTESFARVWGIAGVYAAGSSALLCGVVGLLVELFEAHSYPEDYDG
jgi:hypothetical protein